MNILSTHDHIVLKQVEKSGFFENVQTFYTSTSGDERRAEDLLKERINDCLRNEIGKRSLYEVISGASIGVAVIMLITPGFITDTLGFILLIPFTRKIIINFFIKKKKKQNLDENTFVEGEVLEDDKKDKDEL